jgi:hypothetical protein
MDIANLRVLGFGRRHWAGRRRIIERIGAFRNSGERGSKISGVGDTYLCPEGMTDA